MAEAIVSFNAGSSSIKFALFRRVGGETVEDLRGEVEGLGRTPRLKAWSAQGLVDDREWPGGGAMDQEAFTGAILDWADERRGDDPIVAYSHRVTHGGPDFAQSVVITPEILGRLEALCSLAPLHQPHNLAVVRAVAARRPGALQIACFDTAFHSTLPAAARRVALPREWEAQGVRRYGFHGLSYSHLARRLAALDPEAGAGRVVFAHLGSGASLCAALGGRSIDTTMGFSALDGLVMSTRCGTLDPGVVLFLLQNGLSSTAVEDLLYRRSGLLGVSGVSGDMRALLASDRPSAQEAIELFLFTLAREIGAMTASLQGLDALVFSAGIGEHSAEIRQRACARLGWLGVRLDPAANAAGAGRISAADSAVRVWVIPTDEERMLAEEAARLLPTP